MPEQAHEPIPDERRGCPDHDFVIQRLRNPCPDLRYGRLSELVLGFGFKWKSLTTML